MRKVSVFRLALLGIGAMSLFSAVAAADGPFQFYSVTPCRIADTRNPPGVTGGPALSHGAVRNFPIHNQCGVPGGPTGAKAAVLNVTIVGPSNFGHLTIWPYNTAVPLVSTINFSAGEAALANGAIVPLTNDASFNVSVSPAIGGGLPGNVHLIIDVTGYFQ
jgi:hypothetical protein